MGIYSTAKLIWGIPVVALSEGVWDEEAEDWVEFESELDVVPYGHYDDDEPRGILTSTRVKSYSADCWEPKEITKYDLSVTDKALSKATDMARAAKLPYNFYAQAGWHLVASVG